MPTPVNFQNQIMQATKFVKTQIEMIYYMKTIVKPFSMKKKITTKNSHIILEFSCKFIKKIYKKRHFPSIFSKNFNWQEILLWLIISYKIIKFVSILYKICCEKCFIQNILQKNL